MAKANTEIKWYGDFVLAEIEDATEDGLFAGAQELIDLSKSSVPVSTGTLRDSGYAATENKSSYRSKKDVHKKELKPRRGTAIAAYAAFYANFVERGSKTRPANPFLRSTLDSHKNKIVQIIIGDMQKDLK